MASGIASPWGNSVPGVAGLRSSFDINDRHINGQQSINSVVPEWFNGVMVSPLTTQNNSFYTRFGKKNLKRKLNEVNKEIIYLKKQH